MFLRMIGPGHRHMQTVAISCRIRQPPITCNGTASHSYLLGLSRVHAVGPIHKCERSLNHFTFISIMGPYRWHHINRILCSLFLFRWDFTCGARWGSCTWQYCLFQCWVLKCSKHLSTQNPSAAQDRAAPHTVIWWAVCWTPGIYNIVLLIIIYCIIIYINIITEEGPQKFYEVFRNGKATYGQKKSIVFWSCLYLV